MKKSRLLGELLIQMGYLSPDQLAVAIGQQKFSKQLLGQILVKTNVVTHRDLNQVLARQRDIPAVRLLGSELPADVVNIIPITFAERWQVVALGQYEKKLRVAVADPTNDNLCRELEKRTGLAVEPYYAPLEEIQWAIKHYYRKPSVPKAPATAKESLRLVQPEGPVVQLVDEILALAVRQGASDIHWEPQEDKVLVRFRIDGVMREVRSYPVHLLGSLISRIKIMASMDIAERRLPQDGRLELVAGEKKVNMRVSSMPTLRGEKVVLRVLDEERFTLGLDNIGFLPQVRREYDRMVQSSHGMILVTGPTGCGKTTTLYSSLLALKTPEKNIMTIEDPVEYQIPGISQVPVNAKTGLNFAVGLKHLLRQDPDIIMIGEIRDRETADIAVRAALTGHLVFSTLHTSTAVGAVTRLIDMGVEPFLVASALLGVLTQRLVRLICPYCREPFQVPEGAPERIILGTGPDTPLTLYRGKGCDYCHNSGYRGRTSLQELLFVDAGLRMLVNAKAPNDELEKAALGRGMRRMQDDAVAKVKQGVTTIEEIIKAVYVEEVWGLA